MVLLLLIHVSAHALPANHKVWASSGLKVDCVAHPGVCNGVELAGWFMSRELVRVPQELAFFWPLNRHFKQLHLCHRERLAFSHVFKSAGTTITRHLRLLCGKVDSRHEGDDYPAAFFRAPEPALLFTVVKEPIARLKSAVGEVLRRGNAWWRDPGGAKSGGETIAARNLFEAMLGRDRMHLPRGTGPNQRCFMDVHLMPQFVFVQHKGRRLLLNFIGRVEDMGSVMEFIQLSLGLRRLPDVHMRKHASQETRSKKVPGLAIDRSDVLRVCTMYWMDYAYFRYPLPAECAQNGTATQRMVTGAVQRVTTGSGSIAGSRGARRGEPTRFSSVVSSQPPHRLKRLHCASPHAKHRARRRRRRSHSPPRGA